MDLPPESVEKFIKLCEEEFGIRISEDEARIRMEEVLALYRKLLEQ